MNAPAQATPAHARYALAAWLTIGATPESPLQNPRTAPFRGISPREVSQERLRRLRVYCWCCREVKRPSGAWGLCGACYRRWRRSGWDYRERLQAARQAAQRGQLVEAPRGRLSERERKRHAEKMRQRRREQLAQIAADELAAYFDTQAPGGYGHAAALMVAPAWVQPPPEPRPDPVAKARYWLNTHADD